MALSGMDGYSWVKGEEIRAFWVVSTSGLGVFLFDIYVLLLVQGSEVQVVLASSVSLCHCALGCVRLSLCHVALWGV